MIGGIFETIGKTLGVGKEKYFLELDDAAEDSIKNIKEAATKAAKTAVETVKEVSGDVVDKAQDLVDNAADGAQTGTEQVANKAEAAANKAEKKAKVIAEKPASGEKGAPPSAPAEADGQPVEAAPAPAAPSAEDLIVAAIAATAKGKTLDDQGNVIEETVTTFATDYLETPSRASRRRPGPSLSPFKGMAREVNPRLKG